MKRNRILSVLASLVMLIQPMQDTAFPVSAYTVWNGTADIAWHDTSDTLEESTEFHISTAEQLAGLAKEVNENGKNFKGETIYLDADIYLNAPGSWTQSWVPDYSAAWNAPIRNKENGNPNQRTHQSETRNASVHARNALADEIISCS